MALVHADRVKETSTTTGTGTYTLAGAVTDFQSFAAIGNGNTCYYTAFEAGAGWEVGIGTYTAAGTTLARTQILASSNSNNAVNWSAGTREIWVGIPASKFRGLDEIITQGVHEIWIDSTAMTPRATNGAELVDYDSGASDQTMKVMAFDTTTQEYAHFKWGMPKGWNEGTITFKPYWTNTGGASTQNVVWSLSGRALGNDDAINGSQGTAQTSDDTWLAQNDLHIGPESSAITIGNTPAESDLVLFEVSRVVGSDNMAGDALLIGVIIRLTINAANDA